MGDKERSKLIMYLKDSPKTGDVIAKTGGVRKLRWTRPGKGKRGGVRIIYYFYDKQGALFLLTVYAKSDKVDLSEKEKSEYKELVSELILALKGENK